MATKGWGMWTNDEPSPFVSVPFTLLIFLFSKITKYQGYLLMAFYRLMNQVTNQTKLPHQEGQLIAEMHLCHM